MVPFLGEFNYYMPYVILVPTLITLFNVFAKMFAICSISDNFFDNDDDEGGIGGDLEEGVQVLKDGKHYSLACCDLLQGTSIILFLISFYSSSFNSSKGRRKAVAARAHGSQQGFHCTTWSSIRNIQQQQEKAESQERRCNTNTQHAGRRIECKCMERCPT